MGKLTKSNLLSILMEK